MSGWVVADDGVRLAIKVGGLGPPLVLCHGGPGMWDYFDSLRPDLEDVASVVTWDQRGCGNSDPGGPHTVERYVADLDCIREALGLERWVVGGHSSGASLALMYALAHPDRASALLYLCGTGLGHTWNPRYHEEQDRRRNSYQARLDALSAKERSAREEAEWRRLSWQSDLADPSLIDRLVEALDRPYPMNFEANAELGAETKTWSEEKLIGRCRRLECPSLIINGREDPRPMWAVDSLVAALPNAELVVLDDVGHVPWVEAPELYRSLLRTFLANRGSD